MIEVTPRCAFFEPDKLKMLTRNRLAIDTSNGNCCPLRPHPCKISPLPCRRPGALIAVPQTPG